MASWWHMLVAVCACLCAHAMRVSLKPNEASGKANTGTEKAEMKEECLKTNVEYYPQDMPNQTRTKETTNGECQKRCADVNKPGVPAAQRCAHFTYYSFDGGCHLQACGAEQRSADKWWSVGLSHPWTGPPSCQAVPCQVYYKWVGDIQLESFVKFGQSGMVDAVSKYNDDNHTIVRFDEVFREGADDARAAKFHTHKLKIPKAMISEVPPPTEFLGDLRKDQPVYYNGVKKQLRHGYELTRGTPGIVDRPHYDDKVVIKFKVGKEEQVGKEIEIPMSKEEVSLELVSVEVDEEEVKPKPSVKNYIDPFAKFAKDFDFSGDFEEIPYENFLPKDEEFADEEGQK